MKFAVPMAGTSKIEARLHSILDTQQNRSAVTKPLLAVILLAASAALVPLAAAKEQTANPNPAPADAPSQTGDRSPAIPTISGKSVSGFNFTGNKALTSDELQKVLVSKREAPSNWQNYAADTRAIQKAYFDRGFAATVRGVSQDEAGVITYSLQEAKLTRINLSGLSKVDPAQIRKLITTPTNTPFDLSPLRRDLARVYETQLFEDVSLKVDDDPHTQGGIVATLVLKEKGSNS